MNKSFYIVFFISIIILDLFFTACSTGIQSAQIDTFTPTNLAFPVFPTKSPTVFITQNSTEEDMAKSTTIYVPSFPTPEQPLSIGVVQDGPFVFDLRFYRDSIFGTNPITTSLYSDLEEIGIYFVWEYHGPNLPPPVTVYWGIDPDISSLLQQYKYVKEGIKDGDKDGREGGLILPKGSRVGDQLEAVIKIETQDKTYGAVIRFLLKLGDRGLEPDNVTVHSLGALQNQ